MTIRVSYGTEYVSERVGVFSHSEDVGRSLGSLWGLLGDLLEIEPGTRVLDVGSGGGASLYRSL